MVRIAFVMVVDPEDEEYGSTIRQGSTATSSDAVVAVVAALDDAEGDVDAPRFLRGDGADSSATGGVGDDEDAAAAATAGVVAATMDFTDCVGVNTTPYTYLKFGICSRKKFVPNMFTVASWRASSTLAALYPTGIFNITGTAAAAAKSRLRSAEKKRDSTSVNAKLDKIEAEYVADPSAHTAAITACDNKQFGKDGNTSSS